MTLCTTVADYHDVLESNEYIVIEYNISKSASFETIDKDDIVEVEEDNVLLVIKEVNEQFERVLINFDCVRKVTIKTIQDCSQRRV